MTTTTKLSQMCFYVIRTKAKKYKQSVFSFLCFPFWCFHWTILRLQISPRGSNHWSSSWERGILNKVIKLMQPVLDRVPRIKFKMMAPLKMLLNWDCFPRGVILHRFKVHWLNVTLLLMRFWWGVKFVVSSWDGL